MGDSGGGVAYKEVSTLKEWTRFVSFYSSLKSLPLTPNFHLYKELQGQKKKEDLWEAGGIQHHQEHKETK